ncbi:MAG: lipopolysaccharide assembly protein LapA domain-containing protein [Elusimicrobiota bacterium]
MQKKQIVLIGIFILILIFMVQNTQSAVINLLFWNLSIPIILLIAIILVIGILSGIYLGRNKKV